MPGEVAKNLGEGVTEKEQLKIPVFFLRTK
jgi:hypothetical protein